MDEALENKMILNAYRGVLRSIKSRRSKEETKIIRKAFNLAVNAHRNDRRKSGEPYIFHPLAVARICGDEIGLGTISIVCALMHDTVEDTSITLSDIEKIFGHKVKSIIDGLTKISGEFDFTSSSQAENFKKMFLTIPDDVRVILIKLADRLHNMRTLDSMKESKKLKIASETSYLYAPLAHRLGLFSIKTELEDLSFKFTYPNEYSSITKKLQKTKAVRERFIQKFSLPIKKELDKQGFKYQLKARTKGIPSIYRKTQEKGVDFEEIFDVFAIRIILDSKDEKADCWKVYSIVTDFYIPNPERLRDWISYPKQNGYESLHTTVMSPTGKWVEVQIRTERMDVVAEKGLAAHWKYKEKTENDTRLDKWISDIREIMENRSKNTTEFLDEFKNNLYSDEIYVFTPKGDLFPLPLKSTALDFAFSVHSDVGAKCIGAKVNSKLVPLSYVLKSGDQIEILTSKNQIPKEGWLDFVITSKAKYKIKQDGSPSNENTVEAHFEDLTTIYAKLNLPLGGTYVKLGYSMVEVISIENMNSGNTYGNDTSDGLTVGIGYDHEVSNGFSIRAEITGTDFSDVNANNGVAATGNRNEIVIKEMIGARGTISLVKSF